MPSLTAIYERPDGTKLGIVISGPHHIVAVDGQIVSAAKVVFTRAHGTDNDAPLVAWIDASGKVLRVDNSCAEVVEDECARYRIYGEAAGAFPAHGVGLVRVARTLSSGPVEIKEQEPGIFEVRHVGERHVAPGTLAAGRYSFGSSQWVPDHMDWQTVGQRQAASADLVEYMEGPPIEHLATWGARRGIPLSVDVDVAGGEPWKDSIAPGRDLIDRARKDIQDLDAALREGCLVGYGSLGNSALGQGLVPLGPRTVDDFRVYTRASDGAFVWFIRVDRQEPTQEMRFVLTGREAWGLVDDCTAIQAREAPCVNPDAFFRSLDAAGIAGGDTNHSSARYENPLDQGSGEASIRYGFAYSPDWVSPEMMAFAPHQVVISGGDGWLVRADVAHEDLERLESMLGICAQ